MIVTLVLEGLACRLEAGWIRFRHGHATPFLKRVASSEQIWVTSAYVLTVYFFKNTFDGQTATFASGSHQDASLEKLRRTRSRNVRESSDSINLASRPQMNAFDQPITSFRSLGEMRARIDVAFYLL